MVETQRRGVLLNGIFDFIMENIKHNVATLENYIVLPIPDLFRKKEACFFFTTASASITASQGILSDLTTLHRVGDITITTDGDTAFLTAAVALDVLKVVFGHYTLQAALLKKSGDMLALDVRNNAFDAKLVVRMDGLDCEMTLDEIVVKEFSDVKVDLTGFSVLNPIGRKLAEWFISLFNDFIKDVVETYAKSMVNDVICDREMVMRLFGNAIHGVVNSTLANSQNQSVTVDTEGEKPARTQIPNGNQPVSSGSQPLSTGNHPIPNGNHPLPNGNLPVPSENHCLPYTNETIPSGKNYLSNGVIHPMQLENGYRSIPNGVLGLPQVHQPETSETNNSFSAGTIRRPI